MTDDTAAHEALYHVETALMAAQACLMGEKPEDMSHEDAKTETLLMVREALLTHLRQARSIPAAAALLREHGWTVEEPKSKCKMCKGLGVVSGSDDTRTWAVTCSTCNGTGKRRSEGG